MVCEVHIYERPKLNSPILIEGLPGIGFVANISVLHLIHELDARLFAEITSSSFQDLTVTRGNGGTLSPINQLFHHIRSDGGRDLILWYGNTQALTTFGQYELCGRILTLVEELGCEYIVTLGGFKIEKEKTKPQMYCAATDPETLKTALDLNTKVMVGQIFGLAGITLGLAQIRNLKGFSLLVETPGTEPDQKAAQLALNALTRFLDLEVSLKNLETATEETEKILESFGLITTSPKLEKKKGEETQFRWYV